MMGNWIIAPVLLPAIAGAFLVMTSSEAAQRRLSVVAVIAGLVLAPALAVSATVSGPQVYLLGDWPAPFGIVLVLDRLSALMLVLTAGLSAFVMGYVLGSDWDRKGRHFHALFQFQLMGLNGAFLTGDIFNLFVFFEVLLIASYGLMVHGGGKERLQAGVQYVGFNLIGSTLFLFALGLIYATTGTLNMADLAVKVPLMPEDDTALLRVAGVMLLIVFAVKGALVPFQLWLPGTYANAPGPIAALFAVMTKVGAYAVIRVFTPIFPPGSPATGSLYADLLLPAALVTLAIGAFGVLGASSLFRMVAFAGIASMGLVFTAVSSFTGEGLVAALYYLVHSTVAGALMFLVADLVLRRRGTGELRARPAIAQAGLLASLFFLSGIASAGLPPLSGFIGKLLVLQASSGSALTWAVILGGSFVMIVGFARAGSVLFWAAERSKAPPAPAPDRAALAATLALAAVSVALTVFAGPLTAWLEPAAALLIDPAQTIGLHALPGPTGED
nr:monovalent cation/H+ antiporter subunit D [Neotabrizicola shimadae]